MGYEEIFISCALKQLCMSGDLLTTISALNVHLELRHNSPIYNECQTQVSIGIAHRDDSNDTPQPICECQVSFPLLEIRINQDDP